MERLSINELRIKEEKKAERKINKHRSAFNTIKKVFVYAKEYRIHLYLTILFDIINSVFELLIPIY